MASKDEKVDFSKKLKSNAKKYHLSIRQKAFVDLVAMGWSEMDAYLVTGLYNMIYNKRVNERDLDKLMSEEFLQVYLDLSITKVKKGTLNIDKVGDATWDADTIPDGELDMAAELSKENQLRELLIAKNKLMIGTPDWLKVKQMIADITQAKKDEIKEEDNTIHFYLPLTCHYCELYMNSKKKRKKGTAPKEEAE